jgi:hypothetical protein
MARIASATTTVVNAYLTEVGRQALYGFNQFGATRFSDQGEDLLRVTDFSLYDTDVNYQAFEKLESGDVPDISGTGTNECLKTFGNSLTDGKKRIYY